VSLRDAQSVLPALTVPIGANPIPEEEQPASGASPGIGSLFGAAFRTENTVGSLLAREFSGAGISNEVDPSYSPWNDIKGTAYEEHWDSFANSNNSRYTQFLKTQIDREAEDRRTLAAGGWGGTVTGMIAGIIDPTLLIPVGGEVALAGKATWRLGRGALAGARAGGIGTAIQEGLLQSTQETRTAEDTAFAIGGGIVLGGLLGGGAAALLSRPEQIAAQDAIERLHQAPMAGDAGAMAVRRATVGDLTVAGRIAARVAEVTKMISPNLRANFREAPSARQFSQELAENTLYQTMHDEGRTLGAAVETQARSTFHGRLADGVQAHDDIFKEMKKSGLNMSRQEFDEAVGGAMRRGDATGNDFVDRAAKAWRERVFDPFKNEAIDMGLLPADVSVNTAESYFSRVWDRERLTAQEAAFKEKVSAYYSGRIAGDYDESVRVLQERNAALDQEVADLRMSPEDRTLALAELDEQGAALDAANADQIEQVSRINELRRAARVAREGGDRAGEKAARDEISSIRSTGGDKLKSYLKERGKLRSRSRKVDMNYAGMADRADAIQTSISDIQEANVRGVQRLVSRGRTLEREAQRLDPDKLRQKVSDLRASFYDLIVRSEKAAERIAKAIAGLGENAPAGSVAKLEKAAAAEAARHERLNSISSRLEAAEALDPHASLAEVKASIDDMVREVSDVSLGRGEKAARLKERLARLDPKKIDERIANVEQLKAKMERDFYDRWEIGRLGDGVDPHAGGKPDFTAHAKDIADEVFDKLTGRAATASSSAAPEYLTPITRGPMKDRTFNIPDELVEEFLDSNVRTVAERYGRTMSAEIELTRRFGRADMRDQLQTIRDEYRQLRESVGGDEKKLKALRDDENGAITDLEAMRDLIRGTYKAAENAGNYARTVRALMAFNYIRKMGGAVLANLAEIYRPAMVHGLGRYMQQGIAPLLTNMAAIKLSVKEAKLAGQVTERVLQSRMMALGEIGDPYRSGTAVERWLTNGSRLGSKWNGLVYWTDGMKAISSVLSQNRIIEAAISGTKDTRLLAYLGIDRDMAERIAAQFAEHGSKLDDVKVANTERWDDANAVRAYRAAVSKDVDSIIVTKSVGDVPLFANTPTGKLILQFRNYTFAAHQRVTLRGLQEDKAQFLSGTIAMAALGMLGASLRSWRGGGERFEKFKESARNPGYLIGEGLDLSGVFALPIEFGNTVEKLTQPTGFSFNPVKTPLLAAGKLINPDASMQGSSIRFSSRDPLGALLGPTADLPATVAKAAGAPANYLTGGEVADSQARAAASLIPFGSYLGMREALQVMTDDSPYQGSPDGR
jgi:hypothetical protein